MRTLTSLLVVSSLAIGASALAQPAPSTGAGSGSAAGSAAGSGSGSDTIDPASVNPADMPTAIRLRRLEQKTQALKERAWQLKSRVQLLKEQLVGGGVGAQALIAHVSEMSSSFRLTKLVYTLDGTQVFVRSDETAEDLYKSKAFDVFAGPISPGNHTLAVTATYRGHGYGVFDYLSKYTFTARGNSAFVAGEGKLSTINCKGYEKGSANTPLENRPAIECKVSQSSPEKADAAPAPASTPAPASSTPAPAGK
ncbi:MAG TPA: hypothetical protein VGM90_05030 [Kofleriaceae bacterium]|jgi:hypothetical protein